MTEEGICPKCDSELHEELIELEEPVEQIESETVIAKPKGKKKYIVMAAAVVMLAIFLISGGGNNNAIYGTWHTTFDGVDTFFHFEDNGTLRISGDEDLRSGETGNWFRLGEDLFETMDVIVFHQFQHFNVLNTVWQYTIQNNILRLEMADGFVVQLERVR